MHILTINVGSSSVRVGLFQGDEQQIHCLAKTKVPLESEQILFQLEGFLKTYPDTSIDFIAYRVVHGGATLPATCLIDKQVEQEIERLTPLAPLHHPLALQWIRACQSKFPQAQHMACFDTGFFQALPHIAAQYAVPKTWRETFGLRRFGFHGLAHHFMWNAFAKTRGESAKTARVVSLQLGSGCSAAAILGGKAMDCSMGFTPLEGLMMAQRCGDVDPGMLLYLLKEGNIPLDQLTFGLYHEAGLLGLSGISADMRELLASQAPEARLAIEAYCYRVRKYIGAFAAALGGMDAILIGGGVGEHSALVRSEILQKLVFLGVSLDEEKNAHCDGFSQIAKTSEPVQVWVIPVDEETMMVEEVIKAKK